MSLMSLCRSSPRYPLTVATTDPIPSTAMAAGGGWANRRAGITTRASQARQAEAEHGSPVHGGDVAMWGGEEVSGGFRVPFAFSRFPPFSVEISGFPRRCCEFA